MEPESGEGDSNDDRGLRGAWPLRDPLAHPLPSLGVPLRAPHVMARGAVWPAA